MEIDQPPSEYFSSYEDLDVHRLMLEDDPRTSAYRKAIMENKEYFKNKIVMDVGCGTGILSIFCAQAGAKKVYAVEASNLANVAREIVKENSFEDIIEVVHNKVEDVTLPDNIKVDAIVSEWMGFYLLNEGMLDSVLVARDKFLKRGGEMFPESAAIYVAPCSVPTYFEKWTNIHGISMKSFGQHLRNSRCNKPDIMTVQQEDLLAPEEVFAWVSMKEDVSTDLDKFSLQHVVGATKSGLYQGLCIWFECMFPNLSGDKTPLILNTSPSSEATHWKQTVIVLPQEQELEEGEPVAFQLDMNRVFESRRRYNFEMTLLDPEKVDHPQPCSCYMTKCILIKTLLSKQIPEKVQKNGILEDDVINSD